MIVNTLSLLGMLIGFVGAVLAQIGLVGHPVIWVGILSLGTFFYYFTGGHAQPVPRA
jgi:hypothetical protein